MTATMIIVTMRPTQAIHGAVCIEEKYVNIMFLLYASYISIIILILCIIAIAKIQV